MVADSDRDDAMAHADPYDAEPSSAVRKSTVENGAGYGFVGVAPVSAHDNAQTCIPPARRQQTPLTFAIFWTIEPVGTPASSETVPTTLLLPN